MKPCPIFLIWLQMYSINSLKAKGHDYHAPGYIQANMIMPVHSAILSNLRAYTGENLVN